MRVYDVAGISNRAPPRAPLRHRHRQGFSASAADVSRAAVISTAQAARHQACSASGAAPRPRGRDSLGNVPRC